MPAVSYTPRPDGKREFQSKPTASDRPELNQMLILNELDSVRGVAEAATLFQNVDLSTLVTNYGYIGQRRVDSVVTENPVGAGAALRLNQFGQYALASADEEALSPCVALALEDGTGSKLVLMNGWFRKFDWSFTPGGYLYLDTQAGQLTQTRPTGADKMVQVVGYAEAPSIIRFAPSLNIIKLVE